MLTRLYQNHVLTNLVFLLVLVAGVVAYLALPREQKPSINFNWVQISTVYPGASAEDVEQLVTAPLEDAVRQVKDIRFSSSTSGEGMSTILVRFEDTDERTYDKRIIDLRRVVQAKADRDLPEGAESPEFFELTTANMFPAAMILVSGAADDEVLRRNARAALEDLERIPGVENVAAFGLHKPELQVEYYPQHLRRIGATASDVADTVSAYFRDKVVGKIRQGDQQWLTRVIGTSSDPATIAGFPIVTSLGETPLGSIARVSRGRAPPTHLVRYEGTPGVLLGVSKKHYTSSLVLIDHLNAYIAERNQVSRESGVRLVLLDDQTPRTRTALRTMEHNAGLGLVLVMLTVWAFLGGRMSFYIGVGIAFILAGVFVVIFVIGESLNISVFLGIVIALGMLVDDAVVVMEAIHYRLQRGLEHLAAVREALREVAAPVITSVLTTMAAFLPLMLTPGLLGRYMFVIPLVVTIALMISLIEAFWMLPVHATNVRLDARHPGKMQLFRQHVTRRLRLLYSRALVKVLRRPIRSLLAVLLFFAAAVGALATGLIRADFFADEPIRLFYVNVRMPPSTPLQETMRVLEEMDVKLKHHMRPGELRNTASTAGVIFTDRGLVSGDHYGYLVVSLKPQTEELRSVDEVVEAVRADVEDTAGPDRISFLKVTGGPPVTKPINVKVRGDDIDELRRAIAALEAVLEDIPGVKDIGNDDVTGKLQLQLHLDGDAIKRAGLSPTTVSRIISLLFDGEIVADMRDRGEKLEVRVRARRAADADIDAVLKQPLTLPGGGETALGQLVKLEKNMGQVTIRHYKFRRAITVEADIDKAVTDTVAVNRAFKAEWERLRPRFPGVDLDFGGVFEDIQQGLQALAVLFLLGVGLIYVILGTQFNSYWQPFIILATVPMAFTGVLYGLLVSNNPLSLYTLYGVVALTGIAVNAAIVLITAANDRIAQGMSVLHATVYAARRRLIPILITSLTTIAGLFSLATGLAGRSLVWGPLASSIVWGLAFSTLLTLFLTPLLYNALMRSLVSPSGNVSLWQPPGPAMELNLFLKRILAFRYLGFLHRQVRLKWYRDLAAMAASAEHRILYAKGIQGLREKDFETAMRHFQRLADAAPDNILFNLYATRSYVEFMRRYGWDVGYMARARRHLDRAERLSPKNRLIYQLLEAIKALETKRG